MGTRLVADWLASPTTGVAAVLAQMTDVIDAGDTAPSVAPTVYDDTRHLKICTQLADVPGLLDDMEFPAIRCITANLNGDALLTPFADGQWVQQGTLTVAVQLLLRDSDETQAASDGMYLLRAMRGSLMAFNMAVESARTRCGTVLLAGGVTQASIDAPIGDVLVTPGTLLLTSPFYETTPLTSVL